jgi:hypothetical protein
VQSTPYSVRCASASSHTWRPGVSAAWRQAIYRVRLCFEIEKTRSLTSLEAPLQVEAPGVNGSWTLKQIATSSQLKGQRLDLRSPPVPSEEIAEVLGRRALAALMIVALRRGFGCMLTERLPSGQLFGAGRRALAGDRFDELLDDVLGITVYHETGRVGFVNMPPVSLLVSSPAAPLLAEWSGALAEAVQVSETVSTSFDLWSSSRSEGSGRARLLLLVMAIEALVDQAPRSESEINLLDTFLSVVRDSSLPDDARKRLRNGLSVLKRESVGTSCQRMVVDRLGEAAGQTFRRCYRLRNLIAHGGKAPDARMLSQEANELDLIVKMLLLHRLASNAAEHV